MGRNFGLLLVHTDQSNINIKSIALISLQGHLGLMVRRCFPGMDMAKIVGYVYNCNFFDPHY